MSTANVPQERPDIHPQTLMAACSPFHPQELAADGMFHFSLFFVLNQYTRSPHLLGPSQPYMPSVKDHPNGSASEDWDENSSVNEGNKVSLA